MKTKTIPFDLETAKKIQAGEIEGRIVTNQNNVARILCYDFDCKGYPIGAAINVGTGERFCCVTNTGLRSTGEQPNDGWFTKLFIELPEEAPKQLTLDDYYEGNKVWIKYDNNYILIEIVNKNQNGLAYVRNLTSQPKNLYFSRSTKVYTQKPEFKPFDKVLVKRNGGYGETLGTWTPAIFQKYVTDYGKTQYLASGLEWHECIPYEGNEHLVGTTDNSKKE